MFKFLKKNKQAIKKVCNGSVSVLLCVLLLPFITIATSLIEMSRYQQAKQALDELMNSTALSQLANFDKYLDERFGFLALSQDVELEEEYSTRLKENSAMLGNAITPGTSSLLPSLPLSNQEVLKQQVLDFSETTVLTDIIADDLNIADLIDKLEDLTGLSAIEEMSSKAADLSTAAANLVELAETFKNDFDSINTDITSLTEKKEALVTSLTTLYKNAETADIDFTVTDNPDTDVNEELQQMEKLRESYEADVKKVLDDAKTLYKTVNSLIEKIKTLPGKFQDLKEKIDAAKTALTNSGSSGNNGGFGGDGTNQLYETAINEISEAYENAFTTFNSAATTILETSLEDFKENLLEDFNISYFTPEQTEGDQELWNVLVAIYDKNIEKYPPDGDSTKITETINDIFVIEAVKLADFNGMVELLSSSLEKSMENLKQNVEGAVTDGINQYITAINGIFSLEFFSDSHLTSILNDETVANLGFEAETNPYETLLNGINKIKKAIDDFFALDLNIVKKITAVADLFSGIDEVIKSFGQLIDNILTKITEMVGYFNDGNPDEFYKLLLMSGYMTHNLPNRTNCNGDYYTFTFENGITSETILSGKSVTEFPYNNIITPDGETFDGAEAEYILAGTKDESFNQKVAFFNIYFFRLLLDMGPILINPQVMGTAATIFPLAPWVVTLLIIFLEPLIDTVLLVNGSDIPIIKSTIFLTFGGIQDLAAAFANAAIGNEAIKAAVNAAVAPFGSSASGLLPSDYSTHLMLMIGFTTTEDQMLTRLSNLIYMEANAYYNTMGASFEFDREKTYTCIDAEVTVTFNPFIDISSMTGGIGEMFEITRKKSRGY